MTTTAATNYTDVEIAFTGNLSSQTGEQIPVKVETFRDLNPKARKGQPWGFRITLGDEKPWEYHRRFILQAHAVRTARRAMRNYQAHGRFINRPEKSKAAP